MQRMESEKNISTMIYEACCSQLADNHGHPNNRNCTRAERFGRIAHSRLQSPQCPQCWPPSKSEMSAASSVTTPESLQAHTAHSWPGHYQLVTLTQKSRHTFSDSLKFSGLLMSFLMLHTLATAHILTACVSFARFATVQDYSTLVTKNQINCPLCLCRF